MDVAAEIGRNPVSSTRFSLSVENEQAEAGWDGRTRFARPNSQADDEQDLQPYPVDPYSSKCNDLTYILVEDWG